MPDPHTILGVPPDADAERVRSAYHALVKRWHPDIMPDSTQRDEAQKKLVEINLAYERITRGAQEVIPDAMRVAKSLYERGQYQAALRILSKAESRDAEWFHLQGCLLMKLRKPDAAHESFRAAIRIDQDNKAYRQAALDAALATKKRESLLGRIRDWARRIALYAIPGRARL